MFTNAQTGPGGVGNTSSNGLWLKADGITQTNNTPVVTWSDASGNNNHASAITTEQPLFISNSSFNNMPAVRLDGINDQMLISDADILDGSSGLTFFAVIRPNNLNGSTPRGILGKRISYTVSSNYAYTWFFWGSNYLNTDINTQNNRFNTSPTSFSNNTNYLLKLGFNGSLPSNERTQIDNGGNLVTSSTESSTSIINSNADLVIGALNHNYSSYLGADYAEVIHFNKDLNLAEEIIVNNYLSAKYNINLSSNDLYTHDNSSSGNFDFNVAGIGQASDGSNHTDSQGSGIVRINNPTNLNNDEYLFWGEKTANPTYTFNTNNLTHTEQLNAVWRVQKIGNVGRIDISFDLSALDLSGKQSCQPLQLIFDNDADFSMTDSSDEVYNLTITGTTATATNVSVRNNRYFTLRYTDEIVWNGTTFTNGSGSAQAPSDTDECLKLTVKPGTDAVITSHAHVREIEIETGATLIVNDGVLLEVENFINTNGTINLQGEAQLIQNHNYPSSNSGSGVLIKKQQGATNPFNYNFWSSPVNNGGSWQIGAIEEANGIINFHSNPDADATTTPITLSSTWLYSYNGLSNNYASWNKLTTSSTLAPGYGYTMKGSGAVSGEQEYIFKGIPNDGNYAIPIAAGDDILIGNPYPSAIDAEQFINDNLHVINGSLYFWEHFSTNNSHNLSDYEGGYAIRNLMMGTAAVSDASGLTSGNGSASKPAPPQHIPVGQGFFVRASSTGGNIHFNNGQRAFAKESLNESVFFKGKTKKVTVKKDERTRVWLSFTKPNEMTKQLGLGFDNKATIGYDKGYDAISYDDLRNDANWLLNDETLAIQALPAIEFENELPLKVKVTDAGNFKFKIDKTENLSDNVDIFLKDNSSNAFYNLNANSIDIHIAKGDYNDRFSIVFKETQRLNIEHNNDTEKLSVVYNKTSGSIIINNFNNLSEIKNAKVYNSIGQEVKLIKNLTSNSINISNKANGVYIVSITTNNGVKTGKIIKY